MPKKKVRRSRPGGRQGRAAPSPEPTRAAGFLARPAATPNDAAVSFRAQYRRWVLRRALGWVLIVAGVAMVVVHVVAHLANLELIKGQDLLIGYPMGAFLVVLGMVIATRR